MTSQFNNMQFKRGNKSANDTLTGPRGSISIDFESQSIRVHDGVTPGGAFEIKRGAAVNSETLEFTTSKEDRVAAGGQTIFTLNTVDLSNPNAIQVKVDGQIVNNWTVLNNNQIQFDNGFAGGENIAFENVKNLETMVNEALGADGGGVAEVVQRAISEAQEIGGIDISNLVTAEALQRALGDISSGGWDCGVIE